MLPPYPDSFNYRDEQLARLRAREVHQEYAALAVRGPGQWREVLHDFLSQARHFRFSSGARQALSTWAFNLEAKAEFIEPIPHGTTRYWASAVLRYVRDTYEQGDENERQIFLLDLTVSGLLFFLQSVLDCVLKR